ncbi:hypothetical protein HGRIS_004075 [Hohenbuehelia grisea]|uniref:RING-type domain-containing protein n=1 Tax=Hohenbuehelia grisea TaxID=104357 RepID=A0ABR3JHL1_9AGAR
MMSSPLEQTTRNGSRRTGSVHNPFSRVLASDQAVTPAVQRMDHPGGLRAISPAVVPATVAASDAVRPLSTSSSGLSNHEPLRKSSTTRGSSSARSSCDTSSFVTASSDHAHQDPAHNAERGNPSASTSNARTAAPSALVRRGEASVRTGKKRGRSRSVDRRLPSRSSSSAHGHLPKRPTHRSTPFVDNEPEPSSRHLATHRSTSFADNEPGPSSRHLARNSPQPSQTQAIDIMEVIRMRKEIETLKKTSAENAKAMAKQRKTIEELKTKADNLTQSKKEQELELELSKTKNRKNEELLTTIESSVQCQICMELLNKPQSLSPCGHILCLECLQGWFRKAPTHGDDDDPNLEDDADYILRRAKTCPCCRATVTQRPSPVFVVKAITTAIVRAKAAAAVARNPSPVPDVDVDPWLGLFPNSDDEPGSDEDIGIDDFYDDAHYGYGSDAEDVFDFDHYMEEDEELFAQNLLEATGFFNAVWAPEEPDSDDEMDEVMAASLEAEEGEEEEEEDDDDPDDGYTAAQWEPAAFDFHPEQGDALTMEEIKMLRRGCTVGMIHEFTMQYTHDEGLVAFVDPSNPAFELYEPHQIYLGWNVDLDENDPNGVGFILGVMRDMTLNAFRWHRNADAEGTGWCVRRLVRISHLRFDNDGESSDEDLYYY